MKNDNDIKTDVISLNPCFKHFDKSILKRNSYQRLIKDKALYNTKF